MNRLIQVMIVALVMGSASAMSACNTMKGAGKDVERSGEMIQKGVEKNTPE